MRAKHSFSFSKNRAFWWNHYKVYTVSNKRLTLKKGKKKKNLKIMSWFMYATILISNGLKRQIMDFEFNCKCVGTFISIGCSIAPPKLSLMLKLKGPSWPPVFTGSKNWGFFFKYKTSNLWCLYIACLITKDIINYWWCLYIALQYLRNASTFVLYSLRTSHK